jgi:hypothetical protein
MSLQILAKTGIAITAAIEPAQSPHPHILPARTIIDTTPDRKMMKMVLNKTRPTRCLDGNFVDASVSTIVATNVAGKCRTIA